jgi:Arm DNA-binding domain
MRNPPAAVNCPRMDPWRRRPPCEDTSGSGAVGEFIVDVGHHPVTWRRRQKSKGGFASKKEAESALHEFIRHVEGGGDPCPERIELAAHLSRWLEYQRVRGTRARTLEAYEGYIRREIVPVIGRAALTRIDASTRSARRRWTQGARCISSMRFVFVCDPPFVGS